MLRKVAGKFRIRTLAVLKMEVYLFVRISSPPKKCFAFEIKCARLNLHYGRRSVLNGDSGFLLDGGGPLGRARRRRRGGGSTGRGGRRRGRGLVGIPGGQLEGYFGAATRTVRRLVEKVVVVDEAVEAIVVVVFEGVLGVHRRAVVAAGAGSATARLLILVTAQRALQEYRAENLQDLAEDPVDLVFDHLEHDDGVGPSNL